MMILEFVSKIGLNLAELINSGIISYIVTKVAENAEDHRNVKKNIKERANVYQTSAPNDSDELPTKASSDKIMLHITIKNNQNCNVYISIPPEKE